MSIHILDEITIGQIAAGEVIDRPASIVKELIENALDAGATKIHIDLENGGKTRIQVRDNGQGMTVNDLPLAPVAHATSKIKKIDDLFGVTTYGFRGEALSSMAHAGHLDITSRHHNADIAYHLSAYLDQVSALTPTAHPIGTTISLEGLFETIPVRQKFLKSAATEAGHCYDAVLHQLLIRPNVDFVLNHEGKTLLNSTGISSIKELLVHIVDKSIAPHIVEVTPNGATLSLQGAIGRPDLTYGSRAKQWIAVNGRPVKSGIFHRAVSQAFAALVPAGRFPLVVLDFQLLDTIIDVNIHPQKLEVKLQNPSIAFELVPRLIRQALGESKSHQLSGVTPSSYGSSFIPPQTTQPYFSETQQQSLFEPLSYTYSTALVYFQVFETYLFVKTENSAVLLDQHAVHERVLYERLKTGLGQSGQIQPLATPEIVELSPDLFALFEDVQSELVEMGFLIDPFGGNSVIIREVPLDWANVTMTTFVTDLLTQVKETGSKTLNLETAKREALQQASCKAAIKAGKPMSPLETEALIRDFLAIPDRDTCPHGRPVSLTFDKAKLEKLFLRS